MAQKQDKAAAAEAKKARKAASKAKRGQIFQAFNMQRKEDKALIPLMLGAFVVVTGVVFVIGMLMGIEWFLLPVGIAFGLLAAVILFGRRVQRNVYAKADGQPGAAGWALDNMRGRWRVTSAVAGTTQGDFVHRVLGRPGVVLVAEGSPHRVKSLLAQEKKRVARVVGDTPIYDFVVGNDEEAQQVPLRRLQARIMKLPNNLKPAQIDTLEKRMAALAQRAAGPQMPKGPMPQGAKMRSVQRAMRRR
ncbi:hypothetical protein BLA60_20550 [Actinophytocola xinjiangensis]|uniref:DUF4191 family protein n=1 Tax=Actinophytocola xinjiangensis TaxID=485602 RepID=A0A7Z0WKI0_9PSEU|nr:DUF4191 domain-containing protein [Actinophytocola xinjiangensis]OLF08988.1 hypothetical protein BLA60_20550 [Actinophytocola xinjiangensis]